MGTSLFSKKDWVKVLGLSALYVIAKHRGGMCVGVLWQSRRQFMFAVRPTRLPRRYAPRNYMVAKSRLCTVLRSFAIAQDDKLLICHCEAQGGMCVGVLRQSSRMLSGYGHAQLGDCHAIARNDIE
jgi:hypothetical protein